MTKIGVISDTHSYIDNKLLSFFNDVDIIFHAGDIGNQEILSKLSNTCKTLAVYGNIDTTQIQQNTKATIIKKIENLTILMTHIGGYPGKYKPGFRKLIIETKPNIVITGHSHILKIIYDKKLDHLHINPGAYGKTGFHKVRTAIKFIIDNTNIKNMEILELKR
jgi:putative phosphoesterase